VWCGDVSASVGGGESLGEAKGERAGNRRLQWTEKVAWASSFPPRACLTQTLLPKTRANHSPRAISQPRAQTGDEWVVGARMGPRHGLVVARRGPKGARPWRDLHHVTRRKNFPDTPYHGWIVCCTRDSPRAGNVRSGVAYAATRIRESYLLRGLN
jgi:hypothetical protein